MKNDAVKRVAALLACAVLCCLFPGARAAGDAAFPEGLAAELTRDDLGLTCALDDFSARAYWEAVQGLKLAPANGLEPPLAVEKPFTLTFRRDGEADAFTFRTDGVLHNGAACYPSEPQALAGLYEADDMVLALKADLFSVGETMRFSAQDVERLEIMWFATAGGTVTLTVADRELIAEMREKFAKMVYRKNMTDYFMERYGRIDPFFSGSSSVGRQYTFRLADGRKWGLTASAQCWIFGDDLPGPDQSMWCALLSRAQDLPWEDAFDDRLPRLLAGGEKRCPVEPKAFDYGEIKRAYDLWTGEYGAGTAVSVPPGEDMSLLFTGPSGGPVFPSVRAYDFTDKQGDTPARREEVPVVNGRVPGWRGKNLLVEAVFPEGEVGYLIECHWTELPGTLWSRTQPAVISMGVLGKTVPLQENRYLARELLKDLQPADGTEGFGQFPALLPFTLACESGEETDVFLFTGAGVFYKGKAYAPATPETLKDFLRALSGG